MKQLTIRETVTFFAVFAMFISSVLIIKAASAEAVVTSMPSYLSGGITVTQKWGAFGQVSKTNSNKYMSICNKNHVGVIAYYKFRPEAKLTGNSYTAVGDIQKIYKDDKTYPINANTTIDAGIKVRVGHTLDSSVTSASSDNGYITFYYN